MSIAVLVCALRCSTCVTLFFFFNDTATTEIYTLSLHDALPISLDDVREEIGTDIDMVIIDSVDHMQPIRRTESFRLSQKEVYTDVKDLLESQELIGWTTAHAGKEYENKVAKGGSASERYDKEKVVDVRLTLNERKRYGVYVMSDESVEDERKGGFGTFV